MYSDGNQPGPSRHPYPYNNYSFYADGDHFPRNTAADRLRESHRGARRGYHTSNVQNNPNMINPVFNNQFPLHTSQQQNQQKDRKRDYNVIKDKTNRSYHQNRKTKTYVSNQKSDTSIKSSNIDSKIYKCPNCSSQYDFINRNNSFVGKVPLILNCKHTVCQDCIQKLAKNNAVLCPICKNPSAMPPRSSTDNLQNLFSLNFYLIGYIMCGKTQTTNLNSMSLVPVEATRRSKSIPPESDEQQKTETCCFLSCNKKAIYNCPDCNDVYCTDCCSVVHKSAKSLWSHKQTLLEDKTNKVTLELNSCTEHSMDVEFYCTTCNTEACCYCFIEKHEGHTKENLTKLNEQQMEEFQSNKEKVKKMLKQLLISQRRLQDIRTCNTTNIQKKISNYFINLHAKLQYIEKNLEKEISKYETEGLSLANASDLKSTVDTSVNELKNIIIACDAVEIRKMNMKKISNNIEKVLNLPSYLISENVKVVEPLMFEVPPVFDNLEEIFKIKKNESSSFKLVSEEDLPSDYEKDSTDLLYETDADSCISSLSKMALSGEPKFNKQTRKHTIGSQVPLEHEMVEVTHIESLDCFYVQLKKTQYQFVQMNTDIDYYMKFGYPMVEHPQLNELYLVLYQTRNSKIWCRGRVVEIKNGEMEPLYEVFFIDYGSSQTVDVSKLRKITPDIACKKAFAIHCSLYNPSIANWTKNAHVYMGKMINGKQVSMLVKSVNSGVHEVDLMVISSDRGHTSIIDILIHTCSNALSDSDSVSSQKVSYDRGLKIYANSVEFRKYQQERVIIVNVIDPHHIFVHIASHHESLKKLNNTLKQTYKNSKKNSCLPIEGTFVIVGYKDNIKGNWHRGLVKTVDITTEKCNILLVDWGLYVTVDWSNIRLIQEDFTKLETQAILVKLAHIEPFDKGTVWLNAATVFLQKYCRSQETMKLIVQNVDPLEIALFEVVGDVDICINTQLVLENFAVSTGKISETLEWPRNDADPKPFSDEEGFVATLLKKVDESLNDSEEEEDPNVIRQKIEVIKYVDPSLIYIKFSKNEKQEMTLSKELQIHYSKECKTKDAWEVDEFCVVLYNFTYARGKILAKINENKYKVNVYDRAAEIEVPLNKIYEFAKYFSKFPNVAFKSHLANIRPAGGEKWSLSSIEALERMFQKYKDIYATRVEGDTAGKSIPMQIWYAHITIGGALEASITKFVSLNHLLVKLGFAYKLTSSSLAGDKKNEKRSTMISNSLLSAIEKTANIPTSSSEASSDRESMIEERKDSSSETREDLEVPSKSSNSTDWNELIEEEEEAMKKYKSEESFSRTDEADIDDWIPPFPIKETEFFAWITCAESDGILYLREEKLQNVYKEMEQNIKEFFDKEPQSLPEDNWKPDQLCTIKYNDYYYRGKVCNVINDNEITAIMIDYGSDHKLTKEQLIRKILYPKIPAFASKVKLHKVYPKSGAWLDSDYQALLDVVTEYGKIIIKTSLDDEIPQAEVFTDKGININEYLVQTCPNLRRILSKPGNGSDDEEEAIVEEEVVDDDDKVDGDEEVKDCDLSIESGSLVDTTKYTYKVLPFSNDDSSKKIEVTIMSVPEYNKVAIKETATLTDEFFLLTENMQKTVKNQPVIENLELGMPCACQFSEDLNWYRAQIYEMEGVNDCGYVYVFFVDFGNVESVPVTDVKMMLPEWFELPVSCHIANVNFDLVTDKNVQHVKQFMKKLYGKNKLAEVVSKEPLSVNLFDSDGELCYKFLLDKSLVVLK